jgi:hypothetical protein
LDYEAARARLVELCEQRERESCQYLGKRELDGTFGTRNVRAAGIHFLQACNDGWGPSCAALAYIHANGIATRVDADKARTLTSAAYALGFRPTCDVLRHPDRELPSPLGSRSGSVENGGTGGPASERRK